MYNFRGRFRGGQVRARVPFSTAIWETFYKENTETKRLFEARIPPTSPLSDISGPPKFNPRILDQKRLHEQLRVSIEPVQSTFDKIHPIDMIFGTHDEFSFVL